MIEPDGTGGNMKYPKPKTVKKKVSWSISERTLSILSVYSKYSQLSEEEIVDDFIGNLLEDKKFIEWTEKQRNRKKIDSLLSTDELEEFLTGEQNDETNETNSSK